MTTFKYRGVSKEGANINGIVRAYDEYEAVTKLRETCSVVTKIEKIVEKEEEAAKKQRVKVKDKDLAIMCSQFAIILKAGIPVVQCVEMVAEQNANKLLRDRLLKVSEDIGGGSTMAQSFAEHLPDLPTTFIETVRAGEQAGSLEECFQRLEKYFDNAAKVRGKVVGALTYPAIVIVVAIVVFVIIMTVAVPTFTDVFADMGAELPMITKAMMAVSDFFIKGWWIMLILVAFVAMVFLIVRRTENGKRALANFALMKSPLAKIRAMNCSNTFAATMSTMIAAGLPILRALEITAAVVQNYIFSLAVYQVKEDVEQGKGIADSMREHECFPKMLTEMTGVGERTGAMEQTLDVIGDYYSNEVQNQTAKLLALMEPAITVGLAVITVVLLLGIYLPMFSMYDSVSM